MYVQMNWICGNDKCAWHAMPLCQPKNYNKYKLKKDRDTIVSISKPKTTTADDLTTNYTIQM